VKALIPLFKRDDAVMAEKMMLTDFIMVIGG